jgi:4-deoxy-L-threo-5-hexosulose-uronate ketol-isomerase
MRNIIDSFGLPVPENQTSEAAADWRVLRVPDPEHLAQMGSNELRRSLLLDGMFRSGHLQMAYSDQDRVIVGSAVPLEAPLPLLAGAGLAARFFTERREVGVINLGETGRVGVDDRTFELGPADGLYIGRGHESVVFSSDRADHPAAFYFTSYPAHVAYPTTFVSNAETETLQLGGRERADRRTIHKYIRPGAVKSCQLLMGLTRLDPGSVWNTVPVHTHERRSEVYLYFDLPADSFVIHCLGRPAETRHLIVRNREAVVSPSWSIHCGAGTSNYAFVWSMGGENQDFSDMDPVRMEDLV